MKSADESVCEIFPLPPPHVWSVPLTRGVELDLEPGDIVRGCQGLIWATVAGERHDIMLIAGETYEVPKHQRMYFSGFDGALLQVHRRGRGHARQGPARQSSWPARVFQRRVWIRLPQSV